MEATSIVQAFSALLFVIALILLTSYLLRKYGSSKIHTGGESRKKRLEICDSIVVDTRRRLVLVRCDNREHLLLLAPDREMIVESDITVKKDKDAA